mgnify:CR=1 FL=1
MTTVFDPILFKHTVDFLEVLSAAWKDCDFNLSEIMAFHKTIFGEEMHSYIQNILVPGSKDSSKYFSGLNALNAEETFQKFKADEIVGFNFVVAYNDYLRALYSIAKVHNADPFANISNENYLYSNFKNLKPENEVTFAYYEYEQKQFENSVVSGGSKTKKQKKEGQQQQVEEEDEYSEEEAMETDDQDVYDKPESSRTAQNPNSPNQDYDENSDIEGDDSYSFDYDGFDDILDDEVDDEEKKNNREKYENIEKDAAKNLVIYQSFDNNKQYNPFYTEASGDSSTLEFCKTLYTMLNTHERAAEASKFLKIINANISKFHYLPDYDEVMKSVQKYEDHRQYADLIHLKAGVECSLGGGYHTLLSIIGSVFRKEIDGVQFNKQGDLIGVGSVVLVTEKEINDQMVNYYKLPYLTKHVITLSDASYAKLSDSTVGDNLMQNYGCVWQFIEKIASRIDFQVVSTGMGKSENKIHVTVTETVNDTLGSVEKNIMDIVEQKRNIEYNNTLMTCAITNISSYQVIDALAVIVKNNCTFLKDFTANELNEKKMEIVVASLLKIEDLYAKFRSFKSISNIFDKKVKAQNKPNLISIYLKNMYEKGTLKSYQEVVLKQWKEMVNKIDQGLLQKEDKDRVQNNILFNLIAFTHFLNTMERAKMGKVAKPTSPAPLLPVRKGTDVNIRQFKRDLDINYAILTELMKRNQKFFSGKNLIMDCYGFNTENSSIAMNRYLGEIGNEEKNSVLILLTPGSKQELGNSSSFPSVYIPKESTMEHPYSLVNLTSLMEDKKIVTKDVKTIIFGSTKLVNNEKAEELLRTFVDSRKDRKVILPLSDKTLATSIVFGRNKGRISTSDKYNLRHIEHKFDTSIIEVSHNVGEKKGVMTSETAVALSIAVKHAINNRFVFAYYNAKNIPPAKFNFFHAKDKKQMIPRQVGQRIQMMALKSSTRYIEDEFQHSDNLGKIEAEIDNIDIY